MGTNFFRRGIFMLILAFFVLLTMGCASQAQAYINQGDQFLEQGDYNSAEQSYKKVFDDPVYSPIGYFFMIFYEWVLFFDWRVGEHVYPIRGLEAYIRLGNLYRKWGQEVKAIAAYRKALEISPNHAEAENGLREIQEAEKAKQEAEKKIENAPEDFEVVQNAQGKITIKNYKGTRQVVVIPAKIHGIAVSEIADAAFREKRIIYIILPNGITSIGRQMFEKNQLTSVTIPNGVTSIGERAFSGNQLTSVTIPNSVTSIGAEAFFNNQLTSVTIPNSVTSIWDSAFKKNQLTSVTIPNSVKEFGHGVFGDNITTITIGANMSLVYEVQLSIFIASSSLFEEGFINFYNSQGKKAGTYVKKGQVWTQQ